MTLATRHTSLITLGASLLGIVFTAAIAAGAPTLGFREDFPSTTGTWTAAVTFSNPGTGGVGGAGDGYLVAARSTLGFLGIRSTGLEYIGDWTAAGITQIRLWLLDQGATGDLELHLSIGNPTNFWQYVPAIVPVAGAWRQYVVHLDQPADWAQIIGTGTFAGALATTDRILIRHDKAPFTQAPDSVAGAFGLDHILLTDGLVAVEPGTRADATLQLAAPYPNPARGRIAFRLHLPAGTPATLRIIDITGREVRRVVLSTAYDGEQEWTWDGTDTRGTPVPAGVYRVRAGTGAGSDRRFVWLR